MFLYKEAGSNCSAVTDVVNYLIFFFFFSFLKGVNALFLLLFVFEAQLLLIFRSLKRS